ncbi:MAG: hypothetical protein AAF438_00630 [Pseudomonadota bacterium]
MSRKKKDRADHLRTRVAQEAARIMAEQGVRDFLLAKQKAADRLGVTDRSKLPRNTEIEHAMLEYQRLFAGVDHDTLLQQLRHHAQQAMKLFESYHPRLVGPLINGSISENTAVDIHLFSDTSEEIAVLLMENDIPYETGEWRGQHVQGERQGWPRIRFFADEVEVNLIVFPKHGIRQAPLSPIDGKPMKRLNLGEVGELDS